MKKFLLLMIAGLLIFSAQAEVSQVKKAMIAAIIFSFATAYLFATMIKSTTAGAGRGSDSVLSGSV